MHLANVNPAPAEERSPRVSIIVPTLNEAEGIGALLGRLREICSRQVEVIIADGGSTDRTREIAALHADRVVESPTGRARQMNSGAAIATGDILLFLHADVALPTEFHRALVEQFWRSRGQWGRFDIRLSGTHPLFRIIELFINWRSRLTGIATGDQAIFVRRILFHKLGGYEELPLMEDVALTARLKRFTSPFCIATPVTASSRKWEREGILRTILLMWALRLAYWRGSDPATLAARYYRLNR